MSASRHLRRTIAVATTLAVSAAALPATAAAQTGEVSEFNIANITDLHGYVIPTNNQPGAEALKCAVDDAADGRAQAFVSSGDSIGGTPFTSAILDDEPTIEALNLMGLDAMALGNHEFDKGIDDVTGRVDDLAEFPLLGANVYLDGEQAFDVYEILDLDGVNVAFVGTVTEETASLVAADGIEDVEFRDPVAATNHYADELTESGEADVVVALFHEGILGDEAWSENVDMVFAGHTHGTIPQDPTQPADTTQRPLIMQAGNYGEYLADVDVTYDHATDTLTYDEARLIGTEAITACTTGHPELKALIDDAEQRAEEAGQEHIATIPATFHTGANEGAGPGSNYGVESQLNNMVAEAVLWDINNKTTAEADLGIMNSGGLRTEIMAGEVTYADVYDVQPFAGENTYITLSGADLLDAFEQQWREGARPIENLGVSSNVTYAYDPAGEQGERITSFKIDGVEVDPAGEYTVAGSQFILGGGSGFTAFANGSAPASTGIVDVQSTMDYLEAGIDLAPRTDQSSIGVSVGGDIKPGEEITVNLESLIYTQGNEATEVTVTLGDATATADIDTTLGDLGMNNAGQATVTLTVPENLPENAQLQVTTDAGTEISVPVAVDGGEGEPEEGSSFAALSSAGVLGAVAMVLAMLSIPALIDQARYLVALFS